ncbi:MAG: DUF167 domain-containing protein [Candidatus Paceibacter sp.]|nr:DUF167 domain-containing protein [Candidatus Paceibacter sp.]
MKISVKVKPRAKKESVEKISETEFVVSVKEPPVDGRANWAVCRALGDYFGVSPSRVSILSGQSGKNKVVEIK